MLNEVRLLGRVEQPISAKCSETNGYSFTLWCGLLVRVQVPREIGPKLQAMIQKRTLVWVQGELAIGQTVWAQRVIVLDNAKIRHIGKGIQLPPGPPAAALGKEIPSTDGPQPTGPILSDPEALDELWQPCPRCSQPMLACKCPPAA